MRKITIFLSLACVLAVPLSAVPTTALPSAGQRAPDDEAVSRALDFMANLDPGRLGEKGYAERLLTEADVIAASHHYIGESRDAADTARMIALWGLNRTQEAVTVADSVTARGATQAGVYEVALLIAAAFEPARAVAFLQRAGRHLSTAEQRGALTSSLSADLVADIRRQLWKAKDKRAEAAFAEALLDLGWPVEPMTDFRDTLRMSAMEGRAVAGDVAGARALARQIADPSIALKLLISKDYDELVEIRDPVAHIAALVAAEDQRSAHAVAADPGNPKRLLARAQFLRSTGRNSDALALLLPHTRDMAAVAKTGSDAFWLVNDAAYALSALNRSDEAIALMQRLLALKVERHPDLINMAINTGVILNRAGRYREAAAQAEALFKMQPEAASDFGKMWMWSNAACGHALGGKADAAAPWMARLRATPDANRSALMVALLCVNDLDGAAVQAIERLSGDDPDDMLAAAQDYAIANPDLPGLRILEQRLQQVMARPAVAAAVARQGRILKLPLSRVYWGLF